MRITITARHCEIPDELRARARERLERLARIAPRPHDGRVVFVADHGRPTVEVRLHTGRGAVHVGTARGAGHRTALGLVLAGYTKRFAAHRIHILGETEVTYLASLDAAARRRTLETLLQFELPCVVISKGQEPPPELVDLARAKGVAVIRTRLKTAEFYRRLRPFLGDAFAPAPTVHASLADGVGVGLLFPGPSGVGEGGGVV